MGEGNDTIALHGSLIIANTVIDGGAGEDTLIYSFSTVSQEGLDGLRSLAEAAGTGRLTGIENLVLNLAGNGEADSLDLDGFLDSLAGGANTIYVNGDAADSVNLGSGWTLNQSASVDGYDAYVSATGEETIYIQMAINAVTG